MGFGNWPGESNGTSDTTGHAAVETPGNCPICGAPIEGLLPAHLRYDCDGGDGGGSA